MSEELVGFPAFASVNVCNIRALAPHTTADVISYGFANGVHRVTGYLSFIHFTAGEGSPTALQGKAMSFIHGVVTVPLKVRIRAGAGAPSREEGQLVRRPVYTEVKMTIPNTAMPPKKMSAALPTNVTPASAVPW